MRKCKMFSLVLGDFGEDFAWLGHFQDSLRCLVFQCLGVDQRLFFILGVIIIFFLWVCQFINVRVQDAFQSKFRNAIISECVWDFDGLGRLFGDGKLLETFRC